MTTTTIITNKEYNKLKGSLLILKDYYEATYSIDKKKVRNQFGLKGKFEVILMTHSHPDFKNISNTDIPYEYPRYCDDSDDGACRYNDYSWITYYPRGDAFIITK